MSNDCGNERVECFICGHRIKDSPLFKKINLLLLLQCIPTENVTHQPTMNRDHYNEEEYEVLNEIKKALDLAESKPPTTISIPSSTIVEENNHHQKIQHMKHPIYSILNF